MFRTLRWLLLAIVLIVIGIWPDAAAPVELAATGAAVIIAAIPVPVLAAVAVIVWLRHRQTHPTPAAA